MTEYSGSNGKNIKEELEVAVREGVDLSGANLYRADLSGADKTDYCVTVCQLSDGWAAIIGCEVYAFHNWTELSKAIRLYIDAPDEARAKYKNARKEA